jgi:hypothetical protein
MKKDRFGRYLPSLTAVTAMPIYPPTSKAQSMTDQPTSAPGSQSTDEKLLTQSENS